MQQDEKLSGALQENVLVLLCFSDSLCKIIRNSVTANLFESSVFRDIATHAIDFIDQFGEAIKDHLPDSLELILQGSDKRKATSYTRVLDNLYLSKDSVNGEYVISKIHEFVRQQNLKSAVIKAVEAIESGQIAQAEVELQKGLNNQAIAFEVGINLADSKESLRFLENTDHGIHLGIAELDKRDICPRPQEMLLFIAPAKKGKSWALTHFGKHALLQRKKVLHITLEMSVHRCAQRYIQSFFSISKRQAEIRVPTFDVNQMGRLIGIEQEIVKRPSLDEPNIRKTLESKLNREFRRRPPLIIKQFPTGQLTMAMLRAYLDGLERFEKFTPDMLILDYPDLMEIAANDHRLATGKIFRDLRGLGVERNMALVVATQGNRESSKAKMVTDAMVAEDYSKIATADNVLTYSQTDQEHALGLARIFVSNGRNDEDKFVTLISQAYAIGQFCLDSVFMEANYWDHIDSAMQERNPRARSRRQAEED